MRAAAGGDHADAGAARVAGRQRVEDAGAGTRDDDQRRHQEFDAHGSPFRTLARWLVGSLAVYATLAAQRRSRLPDTHYRLDHP